MTTTRQMDQLAEEIGAHFGLDPTDLLDEMTTWPVPIPIDGYVTVVGCRKHVLGAVL